jgi:predicted alpha/beta-hydrolase family hydrolase
MIATNMPEKITVSLNAQDSVSGIIYSAPPRKRMKITFLLAHGAGADQTSDFMVNFASGLASRGLDVITFNFLYTEQKRGVPDRNNRLEECYSSVVDSISGRKKFKDTRLVIGGKSMGGRIASQIAATGIDKLTNLIFLGYPLHPPGKPDQLRIDHLPRIGKPMLFVQGARDPFGTPDELRPIIKRLKLKATIYEIEGGDHSFKVPKKIGNQDEVYNSAQDAIVEWLNS